MGGDRGWGNGGGEGVEGLDLGGGREGDKTDFLDTTEDRETTLKTLEVNPRPLRARCYRVRNSVTRTYLDFRTGLEWGVGACLLERGIESWKGGI